MDLLPQIRSLFGNICTLIGEIKRTIQKQSQAKHIREERKRNEQFPADRVCAIISFDDETVRSTKAEADRQYRTQNSIKKAAWSAFAAASIYALIAAVQSCQMYRQSKVASEALRQSTESFIISQKAYVTVGRQDGVVAEAVMPKNETAKAGLLIYFQNTGHLPARFNFGPDNRLIGLIPPSTPVEADHEFEPMWRGRDKKGHGGGWSGTITIAGNSSYQGILFELPEKQLRHLLDEPLGPYFYTPGKYEYCDGFGGRVCRSFTIRYAGEPYNRFFLMMEQECMASDLQVRMSSIMRRNPPDWEYLNPCALEREELSTPIKQLPQLPR
jgi:hypothetical protein